MISNVSSAPAIVVLDEEFENFKKEMKKEAQEALEKTASQNKVFMNEQAEISATILTPIATLPSKSAVTYSLPLPVAVAVNGSLDVVALAISKKISKYSVDRSVDTSAKKVIDTTIDSSVNSSKAHVFKAHTYISSKSK